MRPDLYQNYPLAVRGDTGLDVRRQAETERAQRAAEEGAAEQRGLLGRQISQQQEASWLRARNEQAKLDAARTKEKDELFKEFAKAVAVGDYSTAQALSQEIDRRKYDETVLWQGAAPPDGSAPDVPGATTAPPAPSPTAPGIQSAPQSVPQLSADEERMLAEVKEQYPDDKWLSEQTGPRTPGALASPGARRIGGADAWRRAVGDAVAVQPLPELNPRLSFLLGLIGTDAEALSEEPKGEADYASPDAKTELQRAKKEAQRAGKGGADRLKFLMQHEGLKPPPKPAPAQPKKPAAAAPVATAPNGAVAAPDKPPIPVLNSALGMMRRPEFRVVDRETGRVTATDDEKAVATWQGQAIGQAFAQLFASARDASERRASKIGLDAANGYAEAMPVEKAIEEGYKAYQAELARDTSTKNARIAASGRRAEDDLLQPYEVGRERFTNVLQGHKTQELNEQLGMIAGGLRDLLGGTNLSKSQALKQLIRVHEDRISNQDYMIAAQSDGLAGKLSALKNYITGDAPISDETIESARKLLTSAHETRRKHLESLADMSYRLVYTTAGRKYGSETDWRSEASKTARLVYPAWKEERGANLTTGAPGPEAPAKPKTDVSKLLKALAR